MVFHCEEQLLLDPDLLHMEHWELLMMVEGSWLEWVGKAIGRGRWAMGDCKVWVGNEF